MNQQLANMIDHTLLKPNVQDEQIVELCKEAREYQFASVCVEPCYVSLAAEQLKDSGVEICTVIGFPLGANTLATKVFEAKDAIANGATEIDYVLSISDVLNGRWEQVEREMRAFTELRDEANAGVIVKVILETCYLTDAQVVEACRLARETGLDFVKTSTGFGTGGATVDHIRMMRETVGDACGVKASGGIRTREDALAMVEAGASRIGASASVAIVTDGGSNEGSGY
ncbi:deoxyribose-phosphate aldolase [Paenibacillus agilis]|uniref:Deoxyribose-phosphate aldolase n=1 Tax=Paenibacillus agilis TaxID=3020863 RepID=A0A559IYG5_9BACL|nr:deoxyribose-phosphate aldolase [Paenibacillus agilis]TVX92673.1 deoxyribose-phosphate aldolase [Paenibacillus agilis]